MDIHELSDKVQATLRWWLDIHHDPEKWAEIAEGAIESLPEENDESEDQHEQA